MRPRTPQLRRSTRWVALAAGAALLVASCTSTNPNPAAAPPAWAANAEVWFEHFHASEKVGFTNIARYYTSDATADFRALDGMAGGWKGIPAGRVALVQHYRDAWGAQSTRRSVEPIYLSLDGAVDPVTFTRPASGGASTDAVFVYHMTAAGARRESFAGSALWAAQQWKVGPATSRAARALVDRYLRAWSTGDAAAVAALYAPGANVQDSLHGLDLSGTSAIGNLAAATSADGALPGAALREIPDGAGRAYYLSGSFSLHPGAPVDRLVLLLDVGRGSSCPGQVAVVLQVAHGKVTAEERYHRVDAERACTDLPHLPGGWWDETTVPDVVPIVQTESVHGTDHDVALWNGTPQLQALVTWALARFDQAGLPQPPATSITFLPETLDVCGQAMGFAKGTGMVDISLCFETANACRDQTCTGWKPLIKAVALHELAHGWLEASLTTPEKDAYLRATHLRAWYGHNLAWPDQGREHAAEAIAWGLMDEGYVMNGALGAQSCSELQTQFRLLTGGVDPLLPCPTPSP